jgi:hypothetical protein
MPITIKIGFGSDDCPTMTPEDLKALEAKLMSALSDAIAKVTTAIEALKTRVEAELPTQADRDALAAAAASLDNILPTPVEPPAPEPTPTPVEPTPTP